MTVQNQSLNKIYTFTTYGQLLTSPEAVPGIIAGSSNPRAAGAFDQLNSTPVSYLPEMNSALLSKLE